MQSQIDTMKTFRTTRVHLRTATKARIVERFYKRLKPIMKTPTFFVIPDFPDDDSAELDYQRVRQALLGFQHRGRDVPLVELTLTQTDLGVEHEALSSNSAGLRCLALDVRAIEKVKDRIKTALWPPWSIASASPAPEQMNQDFIRRRLKDFITVLGRPSLNAPQGSETLQRRLLSLESHGMFFPKRGQKTKRVRTHSFDHGGGHFYRYRLAQNALWESELIPGALRTYLLSLFEDCPNHFFRAGPRISAVDWPLWPVPTRATGDLLPTLATKALQEPRFKGAHDNVELYALENDRASLATEVPVWLEPGEIGKFAELFDNSQPLTGHIDLLRCSKGKIEVWDYKPKANRNPQAGTQVLLYAIALSLRLDLSLGGFRCGYFDTEEAFCFDPVEARLVGSK